MGRPGDSNSPGGDMPDPGKLFYTFSQGRDTVRREDLPPPLQALFDRSAQQLGAVNGQMNVQQFAAMMQGAAALRQEAPPSDRMARFGDEFFRRQDRNGDGLLNFDEMSDALKAERDKWDTNRDGFIDVTEYAGYFQGRMQQQMQENREPSGMGGGYLPPPPLDDDPPRPEEPKPVVYRAGKLPKELPSWFAQLDTDADGQIGLYEWKNGSKPFDDFRGFDVNDDGFVTIAEVLRVNNQNAKTSTAVASSGNGGGRSSSGSSGSSSQGGGSGLGNIFGMFGRRPGGSTPGGGSQDPRGGTAPGRGGR
jgi:Ca2+-binding EF-hand superfamily protein